MFCDVVVQRILAFRHGFVYVPGVKAVITGEDLVAANLGWLPTFHGFDKQMVLAVGKVLFQHQEVAAVFADTREAALDAADPDRRT